MRSKKIFIVAYFLVLISLIIYHHFVNLDYQTALKNLNDLSHNQDYTATTNNLTTTKASLVSKFSSLLPDEELTVDNISKYENNINNEYTKLQTKNTELTETKKALASQITVLQTQYNKLIQKYTYKIPNVKTINQYSEGYPTGCESAALTILLNYYNIPVTMTDVVNKHQKGPKPYYENGVLYGANPYLEFVGKPSAPRFIWYI